MLASVAALVFAQWPVWWRAVAAGVLLLASAWVLIVGRSRRDRVDSIEWRTDGTWWMRTLDRPGHRAVSLRDSRVIGPVITLLFEATQDSPGRDVHLWPDSADPDQLRRLRIRLARAADDAYGDSPPDRPVH